MHSDAANAHEQQQASIYPVSSWIALLGFVCLVDPNTNDLARSSHGDVERNGQADGSRGVQVG
jgi:hypothetical protein